MTASRKARIAKPIIVSNLEMLSNRIFENTKLSPNSDCMRFLRDLIHSGGGEYGQHHSYKDFIARLTNHSNRDLLLSEIVASWYYVNYDTIHEDYQRDLATGETDPAFFLRYRREDPDDPLRLREHGKVVAKAVKRSRKKR